MEKYRYRGGVHLYQKETESNWWVWVIGGIVILAFLSQCSG